MWFTGCSMTHHNLGLNSAWKRAQDRSKWRHSMMMMMSMTHPHGKCVGGLDVVHRLQYDAPQSWPQLGVEACTGSFQEAPLDDDDDEYDAPSWEMCWRAGRGSPAAV